MLRLIFWGFVFYLLYKNYIEQQPLDGNAQLTAPVINPELQTQPQQLFPMEKPVDPRVDNADQPWFNSDRSFMGKATLPVFSTPEERDSDIMSYDTGTFWSQLKSQYMQ